jgi:uncharacterized protein
MVVVVISGMPGCGSSTTAKLLAKRLNYRHISGGDFFKATAKKYGIHERETATASDFMLSKKGSSSRLHANLDKMLFLEARKGNAVIDAKLGIKMLKGAYDLSVWLKTSDSVRAKRIAGRDKISMKQALVTIRNRDRTERATFRHIYGFDTFSQAKRANLIIDTGDKTPDEITDLIISKIRRVFIVHRWDASPRSDWYPYAKKELEKSGYMVNALSMPDTHHPQQKKWVPYLAKAVGRPSENTYLIGHSAGVMTILRYLEGLKKGQRIGGCVLVAGWTDNIGYKQLSNFFTRPINWKKIRQHCPHFIAIHSDNDPFVPMKHGKTFEKRLGAKLIIERKKGHLTVKKLPSVIRAIGMMTK